MVLCSVTYWHLNHAYFTHLTNHHELFRDITVFQHWSYNQQYIYTQTWGLWASLLGAVHTKKIVLALTIMMRSIHEDKRCFSGNSGARHAPKTRQGGRCWWLMDKMDFDDLLYIEQRSHEWWVFLTQRRVSLLWPSPRRNGARRENRIESGWILIFCKWLRQPLNCSEIDLNDVGHWSCFSSDLERF